MPSYKGLNKNSKNTKLVHFYFSHPSNSYYGPGFCETQTVPGTRRASSTLLLYFLSPNLYAYGTPFVSGWAIDDEGCRTPDSGVGICIRITDCKIIYNYIEQTNDISDRITSEIKEYACGYDGDMVKVCCPSKLPLHWTQTISRMGDDSQHRNIKLLPPRSECGKSNTLNRIINGNVTELFEYPWATVLKYQRGK